ncbi:hypothetical protein D3C81_2119820 [compost metagenome]
MQGGDDFAGGVVDDGAAHGEGLLQRSLDGLVGDGVDGFLCTVQCAHDFPSSLLIERQTILALGKDS